jgi:hypothetical protein
LEGKVLAFTTFKHLNVQEDLKQSLACTGVTRSPTPSLRELNATYASGNGLKSTA